jgi:F-type H+-transporting ATPase subunit alpha
MKKVAGKLKLELSQYRDLEAFAQFGSDLDQDTQRTLARGARLVATLNQGERQPMAVEDQVAVIYAATNGYIDRISEDRVPEFHQKLVERVHAEISDVLKAIREGDWSDEIQKKLDDAIAQFAEDFGYDLDEEGLPMEDEDHIREGRRSRADEDEDGDGDGDGARGRGEDEGDQEDDEGDSGDEAKSGAVAAGQSG